MSAYLKGKELEGMYFSAEVLNKLQDGYRALPDKRVRLLSGFWARKYRSARAQEFAMNGFLRRVSTLARCIENVFEKLPPDQVEPPPTEVLSDVIINVQAFTFNVFGSLDNLAWIWVSDKNLLQDNGSEVPGGWVGLGKKNTFVRRSFSHGFAEYLTTLNDWFDYLENFRHALAHRIPLYIPPFIVDPTKEATYRDLEDRKNQAIARRDFVGYERLLTEQTALGVFRPWIMHSFGENARPVVFHSQMLADFNIIEELGRKLLEELDRVSLSDFEIGSVINRGSVTGW